MNEILPDRLPEHIAIIMDGNGRWAKQHTMGRVSGHRKGAEAVRGVVKACREIGIKYLTLYALSVENLSRPPKEVTALMMLLHDYISSELSEMLGNGIRLTTIGNMDRLEKNVRGLLVEAMEKTAQNKDMVLTLALGYGSRDEIIQAVVRIAGEVKAGELAAPDISKELFSHYLFTADMPDPDLLIRTSGEYRLSNFLLWQSAYTEFYFTDVLWPDFGKEDLLAAICEYQKRERRFGLTSEQLRGD
ncbi:MAG: isoprenyl transferase [Syntrophales bacterium]|nr:isoprenyl transferase [Syntrophales bacterium]